MAKKKKSVSSPITRSKEAKEVKDVKVAIDVPAQTPTPVSMVEFPALAAENAELVLARSKLSNALSVMIDRGSESTEAVSTESTPAEAKVVVKKEKPTSMSGAAVRLAKRNKRLRTISTDSAFHHTYVMKLFDRSVDLAQFKEGTPLYPICRAWMANQPRNTSLGARTDTPSPELLDEEERAAEAAEAETPAEEGAEVAVKKVYKMPIPVPLPDDLAERRKLKIPELAPRGKIDDIDMDMEVKPSRDALMREHRAHWVQVRKNWHSTGHKNEERFAETAAFLKEIMKR